jgi:hypothetical protein
MPITNGLGPKRAILYARVSTDEQARTGFSLCKQVEALRDCAARKGYEVLDKVSDPGQSGGNLERSGMDLMRNLAAVGASLRSWRRTATGSLVSPRTSLICARRSANIAASSECLPIAATTVQKASSPMAYSTRQPASSASRLPREVGGVSYARRVRER